MQCEKLYNLECKVYSNRVLFLLKKALGHVYAPVSHFVINHLHYKKKQER